MSNPWFRLYSEFAHDPKVQMMSEAMQRRLVMLFCYRCSNVTKPLQEQEFAFLLRISNEDLQETKRLFVEKGVIDGDWNVINWDKRQFISDSSYERVKRHREKRVASGKTAQNFIPKKVRNQVLERDGNACVYCGSTHDLTMDHDMPQSRGGSDDIGNLLTACRPCNAAKRDLTHDEFVERNVTKAIQQRPHIQKQITDTELSVAKATVSPAKLPPCPHTEIIDLFAKHLPELPQSKPEMWTGARANALRSRWKWILTAKKRNGDRYASNGDEALAWMERFFSYVSESDFLTGRTGKFNSCDLGWLVNEANFFKVLQGNYDNKQKVAA